MRVFDKKKEIKRKALSLLFVNFTSLHSSEYFRYCIKSFWLIKDAPPHPHQGTEKKNWDVENFELSLDSCSSALTGRSFGFFALQRA